ncbi:isocitrate lyase/PEP mutase family protein [Wenxinia marina]|uniref:Wenxma_18, whole genome shotgun sequence n=1 Tax=Wenxinia marina DSM 24838 TaxID=1123501 RepID=A0A0D0PZK9_9RHOB|nr:isocitrate lyase/phosphoenolpyruvate mutase family protein [Wenxinia marina]KIQ67794.1 PEP phosphonomutase [Wenxinia marina DSM 24838]GGL75006.1 2-methylisocitrate lyase [Wenxinia marina]
MTMGEQFRALHVPGRPFILANAWDRGSAKMLTALGAQAIATSSAAHAFTLGRPDGGTVSRDEALAHAADLVGAVTVPVQGDFENGFGESPETCAETVRLAAEIGLAGICIEDTALPGEDAYAFDLAVERIRAAAAAARALPDSFVLTARADGVLTGRYDVDEAVRRLTAFAAAGADCLYAPLLPDLATVGRVCSEVPGPVNVLIAGAMRGHTVAEFAAAGAARLSLGSSLARVTHRTIRDAAEEMFGDGRFERLGNSLGGDIVDALLTKE